MRRVALVVLVACSREPAKAKPAPKEGGSYSELVASRQSSPATETRTELACAKQFVALSEQPRREVKIANKRCQQGDFDARSACYDKRENELAALSAAELWKQAEPTELVTAVAKRLFAAQDAGASLTATERELMAVYMF